LSGAVDIWAVVPVKETNEAKQRLTRLLSAPQRRELALAMVEDVLDALASATGLAGMIVVTVDAEADRLASKRGARIVSDGARGGHTAAVVAGMSVLAREGRGGMLTMPGDIPLVTTGEIAKVLAGHGPAPAFTIVPAHDQRGSNAILCSPADLVPLQFGNDSFKPHLEAARRCGLEPRILPMPGIGLDIDNPVDVAAFMAVPSQTRARKLLARYGMEERVVE